MNRHLRVAGLVLVLGVVLGRGVWQQQGWAAEQAGNGVKQAGTKLKQLFSTAGAGKTFTPVPRRTLAPALAAPMATVTVTSLEDGAANAANCPGTSCRLRDAIAAAATGDTIDISVAGTITLTSGELVISKNLTIIGPGAAQLTVSGNNASRVFNIGSGFTVALSGLMIANGNPGGFERGGGIFNRGALTLSSVVVSNNTSPTGGGIYNSGGSLTIINGTISNNNSPSASGVAAVGGGIYSVGGTLTLTDSTISGNINNNPSGRLQGAAIDMEATTATLTNCTISGHSASNNNAVVLLITTPTVAASLTLTNCTLTANNVRTFGTIQTTGVSGIPATTRLRNTIVAGNIGPNFNVTGSATITSLGNNLDSDGSSGFTNGVDGNIVGTSGSPINALLAPLANYGGPTNTNALLPGSPALNAGDNCVLTNTCASNNLGFNLTTDQRGAGFNRQEGSAIDIGAFESRGFTLAIASGNNQSTAINTAFANPLAVTVTASGAGEPVNGGRVTFTPPGSGASATIAGNPATIGSGTAASGTVTANATSGPYNVSATATGAAPVNFALTNAIPCTPPGISVQPEPQTICLGAAAGFTVAAGGTGPLSYQWRKNGFPISGATGSTYSIPATVSGDAGSYDVVVTGSCGTLTSQSATLTVNPGTAIGTQPTSQTADEGQSVTFSVAASGANLTYQWRKDGSAIGGATGSSYTIASVATGDAGNYDVVVGGLCGNVTSSPAMLTVNRRCATPVVSITGPASGAIYAVGTPVNFTGSFTDPSGGTHTATWTFDAVAQSGVVNESAGTVSASYAFTQAGVYQVTLTVSNGCGEQGTASLIGGLTAMVVVYDPSAGFVTGGGWIVSPPGAYVPNPSLTGKATFGFVSKYKKGNNVPTGDTEFQFALANLGFKSTAYEWLVVSGARAQYKGSGTINGTGDYRFILTAIDEKLNGGGQDKFRIRIWNHQGGGLVYDNQLNDPDSADPTTVIGGGQIVIHTGGNGNGNNQAALAAQAADEINGEGRLREAEVEWQIILGDEGGQQSVLRGGSGAPYFDLIAPGDYDGDGQPDLAIFRRANGHWMIKRSTDGGLTQLHWGFGADLPVAADYDGDGKTDIAVWRGATGQWFILRSSDGAKQVIVLGAGLAPFNDQPAPADYDGDGKADVAVWRAAEGKWYALGSASNSVLTKTGEPPATAIRQ